jgi:protease I
MAAHLGDSAMHSIAKGAYSAGKVVAAICIAPSILANAGLLEGKKATAFSSEEENLKAKGAEWQDSDTAADGKIVTGNGPGAAKEFSEKIIGIMGSA